MEKVDSLFQSIDGIDAAPTAAQIEYYGEIASEYRREQTGDAVTFLTKTVPEWNAELQKAGAPVIVVGKAVEVPKV